MERTRQIFKYLLASFTRRKPVKSYRSLRTDLKRCLSTFDLTLLGVGGTIGAGIYILTGNVARTVSGPAIIISFLIAGIATFLSALSFAEFGARVPKAGNVYLYAYITLGELCAFGIGWLLLLSCITGSASVIKGLAEYIDSMTDWSIRKGTVFLIGQFDVPYIASYIDLFSISFTILFTAIAFLGIKESARVNNFLVLTNIGTILLATFVGCGYIDTSNWSDFMPYGGSGVISGAAICFFSFIGFDGICNANEDARDPGKSVPVSLVLSIFICFLLYFGISAVLTLMVPYQELDEKAAVAVAFKQRGLNFMQYIIGVGAILGLAGNSLMAVALSCPRLIYALAVDGMIFKSLAKVRRGTGIPERATIVNGILTALAVGFLDLDALVDMLSIGSLVQYTLVDICVIVLRYRRPDTTVQTTNILNSPEGEQDNSGSVNVSTNQRPVAYAQIRVIFLLILVLLISLFGICYPVQHYRHDVFSNKILLVVVSVSLFLCIAICTYFALFCKQTNDVVYFKVPLLPWVPVLAIFFNVYLMVSIRIESWIRTLVWCLIGLFVYFGYSIRHTESPDDVVNDQ